MSTTIAFTPASATCPKCRVPDAVLTPDGICHDCDQILSDGFPQSHAFSFVREAAGEAFDICGELDWALRPNGMIDLHPFGVMVLGHERTQDGRIVFPVGKRIPLTPAEKQRAIAEISSRRRVEPTPDTFDQPEFARTYGYSPEAGELLSDFIRTGHGH